MEPHPASAYTDELLVLAGDLDRSTAEGFVLRVFDGGADHGSHAAIANVAAEISARDAQIRRLGERLKALGEDPLAIARIIGGP